MKDEYDFSDSVQNPYCKKLKQQMTIYLEGEVVDYSKKPTFQIKKSIGS